MNGLPIWMVLLICAGVFAASFVDAIGGGGGIISVPVYLLAGLPTHYALGTNKMSAGIGTAASTLRYLSKGYVDWSLALPSVVLAVGGAYVGTTLQLMADEAILKFVLLAVLPLAAGMLLQKKSLPEQRGELAPWKRCLAVWGSSLCIGVYDGFYGPGTGTFLLLAFCLLGKLDVRTASGNVKMVNFSSNMGALTTSLMAGRVYVGLGLVAACFSIAGHYFGAGLAIQNGSKIVRPIILCVIGLLLIRILLELTGIV
ncbi:MAG: TSUP family transporter [Oscillospiraceae bacterium]|nr:TSUP family transporter [Oscillospiraceae bacterium]